METEINKLEINGENDKSNAEKLSNTEFKNKELETIFENKPNNQYTSTKPQSLLSRVHHFL